PQRCSLAESSAPIFPRAYREFAQRIHARPGERIVDRARTVRRATPRTRGFAVRAFVPSGIPRTESATNGGESRFGATDTADWCRGCVKLILQIWALE